MNSIEAYISNNLINLSISHNDFVSLNYVLRESNDMKKKKIVYQGLIQFIEDFSLFIGQCYCIVWSEEKK